MGIYGLLDISLKLQHSASINAHRNSTCYNCLQRLYRPILRHLFEYNSLYHFLVAADFNLGTSC